MFLSVFLSSVSCQFCLSQCLAHFVSVIALIQPHWFIRIIFLFVNFVVVVVVVKAIYVTGPTFLKVFLCAGVATPAQPEVENVVSERKPNHEIVTVWRKF